ncbi:hypothetical protein vBCbaSRXM_113 [Citromicrobium phage vB_CbaS-RXM]|nr:hypothetical protein vBCbaSRXM_113 [Citromicrobium phage vB_CbaS-RXM]
MQKTLKLRVLDYLFTKLFGPVDIDAEIYTTDTEILIVQLAVRTRFGSFAVPVLHKQLPPAGAGFVLDAVEAIDSIDAGVIDHVGGLLPPADERADNDEDTRPA